MEQAKARKLRECMPDFEYSTPMLVMPYRQFKAQGRIMKSVQKWRDEALEQGWLVEFKVGSGKVAIFISHTWWHREHKDDTNDPDDVYDCGSPDYQAELAAGSRVELPSLDCQY